MKAIMLFVTIGAFLGYGLADASQPISKTGPVAEATPSSTYM